MIMRKNEKMPKIPTERRQQKIHWVLSRRQPDLTLVLANIHDPHNVSAIYRSADAFGLEGVHLYYTNTAFPALAKKTSASARKWVGTTRHATKDSLINTLQAANMQMLVTSCSPTSRPVMDYDLTKPTAFIMGNEHSGVPEELISVKHGEVYIPMYGMIQSFNVSVAAAILLAEASRQRALAGMYATPQYDATTLAARLEAWCAK